MSTEEKKKPKKPNAFTEFYNLSRRHAKITAESAHSARKSGKEAYARILAQAAKLHTGRA